MVKMSREHGERLGEYFGEVAHRTAGSKLDFNAWRGVGSLIGLGQQLHRLDEAACNGAFAFRCSTESQSSLRARGTGSAPHQGKGRQ